MSVVEAVFLLLFIDSSGGILAIQFLKGIFGKKKGVEIIPHLRKFGLGFYKLAFHCFRNSFNTSGVNGFLPFSKS